MLSVLRFLAFLCAYALWLWVSAKFSKKVMQDVVRGAWFWRTEIPVLLSNAGFFVCIYLLSGMWSWRLVALFVVAGQLSILLALVVNQIAGSQTAKSDSRLVAAGGELGFKYQKTVVISLALVVVWIVFYLVAAGIVHFRYRWASPQLVAAAVKYTLLYFIGVYPLLLLESIALLSSENLDEDNRLRLFISLLAGLIPIALFVALALWAFGAGGADVPASFSALSHGFSLKVTLSILIFFVVLILMPYFVGSQRGKRRRVGFLTKRQQFLQELSDILDSPSAARYVPKLGELRQQVDREREAVREDFPLLLLSEKVKDDGPDAPEDVAILAKAFEQSEDLDPRYQFLEYLDHFDNELKEIAEDLQAQPPDKVVQAAALWSKKYETRHARLGEDIKGAASAKPMMAGLLTSAATLIFSPILSEVGKAAWAWISSAYGLKTP